MCQRQSQYVWPVYAIWGLLIWARCAMPAGATDPAPQPAKVDFERHVAPILTRHCLECHHGADPAGGLDLSTWERAVQGGDSGAAAIVPRQLEASYLVARIRDGEMPPAKAAPLAEPDSATLEAWITAGADWPAAIGMTLLWPWSWIPSYWISTRFGERLPPVARIGLGVGSAIVAALLLAMLFLGLGSALA